MIRRADIEKSKSNVAMNTCTVPHASYACGLGTGQAGLGGGSTDTTSYDCNSVTRYSSKFPGLTRYDFFVWFHTLKVNSNILESNKDRFPLKFASAVATSYVGITSLFN